MSTDFMTVVWKSQVISNSKPDSNSKVDAKMCIVDNENNIVAELSGISDVVSVNAKAIENVPVFIRALRLIHNSSDENQFINKIAEEALNNINHS